LNQTAVWPPKLFLLPEEETRDLISASTSSLSTPNAPRGTKNFGRVLLNRTAISASDRTPSKVVQGKKTSAPSFPMDRTIGRGDGSFEFVFLLVLFTIMFVIALRFLAALRKKWTSDKNRN
jgi:hypothetical protein